MVGLRRVPGTTSFPSLPPLRREDLAVAAASPARRARKRARATRTARLPRVRSFYADSATQGLTTCKEQLGTTRRERLLAARLRSEPALVGRAELEAAPRVRTRPSEVMEEVSKTFDASRFVNRSLLDSFDTRPFSPPSFQRQLRVALNVDLSRADVDELCEEFDVDRDGRIDGGEFLSTFARMGLEARERDANALAAARERRARAGEREALCRRERLLPSFDRAPSDEAVAASFALFDRDGSGAVSARELREILGHVGGYARPSDPESRRLVDAARALDDVRCEALAACELRGIAGRGATLDAFAAHFAGRLRVCDLYGQVAKALGLRLDARRLSALVAALGGFVPGSGRGPRLVDGGAFAHLVVRWIDDYRNKVNYQNDASNAKRRATTQKIVKDPRAIRGVDPWRGTTWLGR